MLVRTRRNAAEHFREKWILKRIECRIRHNDPDCLCIPACQALCLEVRMISQTLHHFPYTGLRFLADARAILNDPGNGAGCHFCFPRNIFYSDVHIFLLPCAQVLVIFPAKCRPYRGKGTFLPGWPCLI